MPPYDARIPSDVDNVCRRMLQNTGPPYDKFPTPVENSSSECEAREPPCTSSSLKAAWPADTAISSPDVTHDLVSPAIAVTATGRSDDFAKSPDGDCSVFLGDTDGQVTQAMLATASDASVKSVHACSNGAKWQWEHKTGFKNYPFAQMTKIELAYQRGYSKVRIKSGKDAATPMEIFFIDLKQYDPITRNKRNVRRVGPNNWFHFLKRLWMERWYSWYTQTPYRETIADYEKARDFEDERRTTGRLNVMDDGKALYHDGITARIAQSSVFVAFAIFVVLVNSAWLCYDLDMNDADTWMEADMQFRLMENFFCVFFWCEITIRFLAFRRKSDCWKDDWFKFDAFLVVVMIVDTYILPFAVKGNNGKFVVVRLARLLRLARMTRLIRAVPDVMILLKGIVHAFRSVFFTLALLLFIVYVFAIVFTSYAKGLGEDQPRGGIEETYFRSVGESMWTLIMHGTFLDNVAAVMKDIQKESRVLVVAFFAFILLSSMTVLNMLIGIVCDVIAGVKKQEEEEASWFYLKNHLLDIMECYDRNDDRLIAKKEFDLFMQNPEVLELLRNFGTDPDGVIALSEIVLEDEVIVGRSSWAQTCQGSTEGKLTFDEVLMMIMRLQGEHTSKVTDVVELRKYFKQTINQYHNELCTRFDDMERRLEKAGANEVDEPTRAYSVPRAVVDIYVTFGEATREQRHVASLTVRQFLQLFPATQGRLVVVDAQGVEQGDELTLGELAALDAATASAETIGQTARKLVLRVVPAAW